jgi:hypothetical protein
MAGSNLLNGARIGSKSPTAGFVFADFSRGIVVGPYANSEEALAESLRHGHAPENVTVFAWANRSLWDATLQLSHL